MVRDFLGKKQRTVLAVGLASALGLGGCSSGDGDHERVDAVETAALDTVDGVLHDISAAVAMPFNAGSHSFVICGESYAPRGVIHRVFFNFESPAELTNEAAIDATVDLLEGDGWQVERPRNPQVVIGEKGRSTLRLEFGGIVVGQLKSDCVETSNQVAREYSDRSNADIEWK